MQSQYPRPGKNTGFSLAEIMVVIALISIVSVLLLPVLSMARDRARIGVCAANLHQVALVLKMYSADYDGVYPLNRPATQSPKSTSVWDSLAPYAHDPQIFHCPDETGTAPTGYHYRTAAWNDPASLAQKTHRPDSGTVVVFCTQHIKRSQTGEALLDDSGRESSAVLVAREDGSVERIKAGEITWWAKYHGHWFPSTSICPRRASCADFYPNEAWPPSL